MLEVFQDHGSRKARQDKISRTGGDVARGRHASAYAEMQGKDREFGYRRLLALVLKLLEITQHFRSQFLDFRGDLAQPPGFDDRRAGDCAENRLINFSNAKQLYSDPSRRGNA